MVRTYFLPHPSNLRAGRGDKVGNHNTAQIGHETAYIWDIILQVMVLTLTKSAGWQMQSILLQLTDLYCTTEEDWHGVTPAPPPPPR